MNQAWLMRRRRALTADLGAPFVEEQTGKLTYQQRPQDVRVLGAQHTQQDGCPLGALWREADSEGPPSTKPPRLE